MEIKSNYFTKEYYGLVQEMLNLPNTKYVVIKVYPENIIMTSREVDVKLIGIKKFKGLKNLKNSKVMWMADEMSMEEHEERCKKIVDDMEGLKDRLKEAVKRGFWSQSGYPKKTTQNHAIVDEAIEFAVDKVVRINKI